MVSTGHSEWLQYANNIIETLNISTNTSVSPYGLMLVSEKVSEHIESIPKTFPKTTNENLFSYTGAIKGINFNVGNGLKKPIALATQANISEMEANLKEALRGILAPQVKVAADSALFNSAISVDFKWLCPFTNSGDGLMSNNSLAHPQVTSDGYLTQKILTDSNLEIFLVEAGKYLSPLGEDTVDIFEYAKSEDYNSKTGVTINSVLGTNNSSVMIASPWKQETKWKDLNLLLDAIFVSKPEFPFSLFQEVVVDFSDEGFKAAAYSGIMMRGVNMAPPTLKMVKHAIVDWSLIPHYCVCRDPESGAILFVSKVN